MWVSVWCQCDTTNIIIIIIVARQSFSEPEAWRCHSSSRRDQIGIGECGNVPLYRRSPVACHVHMRRADDGIKLAPEMGSGPVDGGSKGRSVAAVVMQVSAPRLLTNPGVSSSLLWGSSRRTDCPAVGRGRLARSRRWEVGCMELECVGEGNVCRTAVAPAESCFKAASRPDAATGGQQ